MRAGDQERNDPRKLHADIALAVWQSDGTYDCGVDGTVGSARSCTHRECWETPDQEEYDEKRALINSLNRLLVRVEELEERVNRLERALEDDGR